MLETLYPVLLPSWCKRLCFQLTCNAKGTNKILPSATHRNCCQSHHNQSGATATLPEMPKVGLGKWHFPGLASAAVKLVIIVVHSWIYVAKKEPWTWSWTMNQSSTRLLPTMVKSPTVFARDKKWKGLHHFAFPEVPKPNMEPSEVEAGRWISYVEW